MAAYHVEESNNILQHTCPWPRHHAHNCYLVAVENILRLQLCYSEGLGKSGIRFDSIPVHLPAGHVMKKSPEAPQVSVSFDLGYIRRRETNPIYAPLSGLEPGGNREWKGSKGSRRRSLKRDHNAGMY